MGFEPTASRATIWRANQLRHTHHSKVINQQELFMLVTCQKGFEPPANGLEGRCSIQLSYWHIYKNLKAGDGNRTHVSSLEGWCSTIELHPHNLACAIGVTGFEPATSWSQTRRSSQAEPHPDNSLVSQILIQYTFQSLTCQGFLRYFTTIYLPAVF